MDKIIFTEEFCQPENLHPFTLTRQIQDIRIGILTIREKWERILGLSSYDKKENDYKDLDLAVDVAAAMGGGACFIIHGNILPTRKLVKAVRKLKPGEFITSNGNGIVFCVSAKEVEEPHKIKVTKAIVLDEPLKSISYPWDIFRMNDWAIREDFELLVNKKKSQPVSRKNQTLSGRNIFLEKGARMQYCIINAATGPVYIGRNAEVMEGSVIRGPFSLGENSVLKAGSKIYGATTIGPNCVAGGEIKNSVLFANSNKAHEGYLGDSVVGEWCNLGAGTSNSNLKNNAGPIQIWTPKGQVNAGFKCGVFMGDYSRTSINTSINTGTVIGVCSNIFGAGLTPKYIPSFSWGSEGLNRYDFEKAMIDIAAWKKMKQQSVTESEESILKYIYQNY